MAHKCKEFTEVIPVKDQETLEPDYSKRYEACVICGKPKE